MICAPWAAALRTSASARAMLPSVFQSHAIWIAATVTGRDGRRKCSGSCDIRLKPFALRILTCRQRLLDLRGDARRRLERHEPGLAGDHRRPPTAYAAEE